MTRAQKAAELKNQRLLLFAHNRVIAALTGLEMEQALSVIDRIRRGLVEYIQAEATRNTGEKSASADNSPT